MGYLTSLTFLMDSEFSEIVKIIFLQQIPCGLGLPAEHHHSVVFSLCFWIPMHVDFVVVVLLLLSFYFISACLSPSLTRCLGVFLSHNPLGSGILQCPI